MCNVLCKTKSIKTLLSVILAVRTIISLNNTIITKSHENKSGPTESHWFWKGQTTKVEGAGYKHAASFPMDPQHVLYTN